MDLYYRPLDLAVLWQLFQFCFFDLLIGFPIPIVDFGTSPPLIGRLFGRSEIGYKASCDHQRGGRKAKNQQQLQLQRQLLLEISQFDAVIAPTKIAISAHRDPLWDHSVTK